MDKIEKGLTSANGFRSHCFPDLNETSCVDAGEKAAAANAFQPLYKGGRAEGDYRPTGIRSANSDQKQKDETAERRQSSYNKGLTAGQNDAHCLLQEEIAPSLTAFKHAIGRFNESFGVTTQASSRNVTMLAMEIVQKIFGDVPGLDDGHMTSIHQVLLDAMTRAYGLHLRLNSDDMENLAAMLKCDPSFVLDDAAVQLEGDGALEKGKLTPAQEDRKPALDHVEQKLAQLLDGSHPS